MDLPLGLMVAINGRFAFTSSVEVSRVIVAAAVAVALPAFVQADLRASDGSVRATCGFEGGGIRADSDEATLFAGTGPLRIGVNLTYSGGSTPLVVPSSVRANLVEIEVKDRATGRTLELDWKEAGPIVKFPLSLATVDINDVETLEPSTKLRWSMVGSFELPVGPHEVRCRVRPEVIETLTPGGWKGTSSHPRSRGLW